MSLVNWLLLASLLVLVVGAGVYQDGRSRIETSHTRKWFGAVFFAIIGLSAVSILFGW